MFVSRRRGPVSGSPRRGRCRPRPGGLCRRTVRRNGSVGQDRDLQCSPGDAEAFHQILSNLLENAIKYTPESGIVTVGAKLVGPGEVEFFVKDTGMGIPAEELPRLFERFYRVDKARSRALGGTGLGLAIVKHLTRAQGGDIRVESKVDRGSTFFFSLPVQDLGLAEQGAIQKELASQS